MSEWVSFPEGNDKKPSVPGGDGESSSLLKLGLAMQIA
jgi:hypothetical protein